MARRFTCLLAVAGVVAGCGKEQIEKRGPTTGTVPPPPTTSTAVAQPIDPPPSPIDCAPPATLVLLAGTSLQECVTLAKPLPSPNTDVPPPSRHVGLMRAFHPSGTLAIRGEYDETGERTGTWTFYDEAGQRYALGAYKAGRRTGTWSRWDAGGRIHTDVVFAGEDRDGPWKTLFDDKIVIGEGTFAKNQKQGTWTSRDCAGNAREVLTYDKGALNGPCSRHRAGLQELEGSYRAGKPNGTFTRKWARGDTMIATLVNGEHHGPWSWKDANGEIILAGRVEHDRLVGEWQQKPGTEKYKLNAPALKNDGDPSSMDKWALDIARLRGFEDAMTCYENAPPLEVVNRSFGGPIPEKDPRVPSESLRAICPTQ